MAMRDRMMEEIGSLGLYGMKDLDRFDFTAIPVSEMMVRTLYGGNFLADHTNVIMVGCTVHRQNTSGHCHRQAMHQKWPESKVLQRAILGEPTGAGEAQ